MNFLEITYFFFRIRKEKKRKEQSIQTFEQIQTSKILTRSIFFEKFIKHYSAAWVSDLNFVGPNSDIHYKEVRKFESLSLQNAQAAIRNSQCCNKIKKNQGVYSNMCIYKNNVQRNNIYVFVYLDKQRCVRLFSNFDWEHEFS